MQVQAFIRRNIKVVTRILEVAVIVVWLIAQFVPSLGAWIREQNLIELVVLVIVVELIGTSADLQDRLNKQLALTPDQGAASQHLISVIERARPETAKLIGLSAGKREDVLNALTRGNWEIRLLVQHPEAAMNPDLSEHLREKIKELANITFIQYQRVSIRLYRRPCLVRGTKLGDRTVTVGWYACGAGAYEFFGHSNPVVIAPAGTTEATELMAFFDRAFDYLWSHPETMKLEDFLTRP